MRELFRDLWTSKSAARGLLLAAGSLALTPQGAEMMGSAAPWVAVASMLLGGGISSPPKVAR